jgi:hypothetical protein
LYPNLTEDAVLTDRQAASRAQTVLSR